MIPQFLSLKNFLSYQVATLDFSGLHIACISGANGAGKSSLLEAITWAVWGMSRAASEDDVIYGGAKEVKVDFTFQAQSHLYRVLRMRTRGGSGSLEFQVQVEGRFKSLTERNVRATQQAIIAHLKMDYGTFTNSAYLRQGRADEFMLKRAGDRKAVLAEMLNLGQYDVLMEKAKEVVRVCRAEIGLLEQQNQNCQAQIRAGENIAEDLELGNRVLGQLQSEQALAEQELLKLQERSHQRQNWQQNREWQQQQLASVQIELERLQSQIYQQEQQIHSLGQIVANQAVIQQNYDNFLSLGQLEAEYSLRLPRYQQLLGDRHQIQQYLSETKGELNSNRRQYEAQITALDQQYQDLQAILQKSPEINAAIAQLQQAKAILQNLDALQSQFAPLSHRRQVLQREIDREAAQIHAHIAQMQKQQQDLRSQVQPQLIQKLQNIEQQLKTLEKKQVYQQRVHEKGLERRDFLNRLKERERDCEERIKAHHGKVQQLQSGDLPCPLCDRPFDQSHWQHITAQQELAYQALQAELWVIKEQQSASDCEIQVLREEYRQLKQELEPLNSLLQQKGNLHAQLQSHQQSSHKLEELAQQLEFYQSQLQNHTYAPDAQTELKLVETSLKTLGYDEKNHALARGEVERWRWAELKHSELKAAQRQSSQILAQIPELQAIAQNLTLQISQLEQDSQAQLATCDRHLSQINYDPQHHQQLRTRKDQAQPALLAHQELRLAQQQLPQLVKQLQHNQQLLGDRQAQLQQLNQEISSLQTLLSHSPDPTAAIAQHHQQIHHRRSQLDQKMAEIGRLQAAQAQHQQLQSQAQQIIQQISQTQKRQLIHQELQQAFGKNGIQALLIETVLPQIEAEANRILATLTNYQLNVRFITQKAGKKNLIDTLDIEIADSRGTRSYETYSGGEVFRINLAIRLSLARIIAQRLGGTLQTLIIDEGFGTQDPEGCDRLLTAINAIAPDFACILVITHIPQLKAAFSTLVEVTKTESGSKINLLV